MRPMLGAQSKRHAEHDLQGELSPLVQTKAATVVHLKPVVGETDAPGENDRAERECPGGLKASARADVTDEVSDCRRCYERDSPHRRCPGLHHVNRRPVLTDLLADLPFCQGAHENRSSERGDEHGNRPRGEDGDHGFVASSSRSARRARQSIRLSSDRTTSRSSKTIDSFANSCVVSWPLPATTTTSPGLAARSAPEIAALRSGSTRTVAAPLTPARISSMITSGSSLLGLSVVRTTTSASREATSPIAGRLPRSRSPPQPNTTTTAPLSRPPVPRSSRAERSTCSSPAGVWA